MEVLGLICILLAVNLIVFAIIKLIVYCGREKLKKSEELRKKAKDGFVNCVTCRNLSIHRIIEKEYCYICELKDKRMPYNNINEERTELLIPKNYCPLVNKEKGTRNEAL